MTVGQLMAVITGPELDAWRDLEQQDPFGQLREDIRTAAQTSHIAAIAGVKRVTGGPFTAADFLLRFVIEPPKTVEQTEEQKRDQVRRMERMLVTWARAHNSRWFAAHPEQRPQVEGEPPHQEPDQGATTETS